MKPKKSKSLPVDRVQQIIKAKERSLPFLSKKGRSISFQLKNSILMREKKQTALEKFCNGILITKKKNGEIRTITPWKVETDISLMGRYP